MIYPEALLSIAILLLLIYSGVLGKISEGIGGLIEGKDKVDIASLNRTSLEEKFRALKRIQNHVLRMSMPEELGFNNQIEQEIKEMRTINDEQFIKLLKEMSSEIEMERIVKGIFAIIFCLALFILF